MRDLRSDLGRMGRDRITGYTGVIMGVTSYFTGCDHVLLSPRELDKDGNRRDGSWFDEPRIEVLAAESINLESTPSKPGADESEALTK